MPDRMPEDMSDRMPEDLPVTACINVMVGITRSKVFFSSWRPWRRSQFVIHGTLFSVSSILWLTPQAISQPSWYPGK
jgi:hypothetical protein